MQDEVDRTVDISCGHTDTTPISERNTFVFKDTLDDDMVLEAMERDQDEADAKRGRRPRWLQAYARTRGAVVVPPVGINVSDAPPAEAGPSDAERQLAMIEGRPIGPTAALEAAREQLENPWRELRPQLARRIAFFRAECKMLTYGRLFDTSIRGREMQKLGLFFFMFSIPIRIAGVMLNELPVVWKKELDDGNSVVDDKRDKIKVVGTLITPIILTIWVLFFWLFLELRKTQVTAWVDNAPLALLHSPWYWRFYVRFGGRRLLPWQVVNEHEMFGLCRLKLRRMVGIGGGTNYRVICYIIVLVWKPPSMFVIGIVVCFTEEQGSLDML